METEEPNSGNDHDAKLESNNGCPWELDFSIIGQNNLDVNDTTFDEGLWYLNENVELAYLSTYASDSTCIDMILYDDDKIKGNNAIWSAIGEIPSL